MAYHLPTGFCTTGSGKPRLRNQDHWKPSRKQKNIQNDAPGRKRAAYLITKKKSSVRLEMVERSLSLPNSYFSSFQSGHGTFNHFPWHFITANTHASLHVRFSLPCAYNAEPHLIFSLSTSSPFFFISN